MAPKKATLKSEDESSDQDMGDRFKMPLPQKFYGDRKEDKGYGVQTFLFDVDLYCNGMGYQLDGDKPYYTLCGLLRGTAKEWLRSVAHTHDSYTALKTALYARFTPVDPAVLARDKLENMQQLHGVESYVAAYEKVVMLCRDVSDAEKQSRFVNGLKPDVQATVKLHLRLLPASDQTYEKAVLLAMQIGQTTGVAAANAIQGNSSGSGNGGRSGGYQNRGGRQGGGRGGGRSGGRSKGACWGCGQYGHVKSNCPNKTAKVNAAESTN